MHFARTKHRLIKTVLITVTLCFLTLVPVQAHFDSLSHYFFPIEHRLAPELAQEQVELDTTWRYTRFGWQDSSYWRRPPADLGPRIIDRISPVLFSIDIVLAVLGAMIWVSEDWQVDRLFGRPPRRTGRKTIHDLARKARRRQAHRNDQC